MLYTSMAALKPEEVLRTAEEMGMPITEEALKAALDKVELSEKEMENAAGGFNPYCDSSPYPNYDHDLEKVGHEEEPRKCLFRDYSLGYDICRCTGCGYV